MQWQQVKWRRWLVDAFLYTLLACALLVLGLAAIKNAGNSEPITIKRQDLPLCQAPQVPRVWLIGDAILYDCAELPLNTPK